MSKKLMQKGSAEFKISDVTNNKPKLYYNGVQVEVVAKPLSKKQLPIKIKIKQ